ncbi:phage major capsid protein [Xanthomonas axonopodis]
MTITEIRQRKAALVAEARTALEANNQADFEKAKTAITELEVAEQRRQYMDDLDRRAAAPNRADNQEQRVSLLDVLRAGIEGRALSGAAAEQHAEMERRHGPAKHGGILVPLSAFEKRANTTATAPELIATQHRADLYIGPLRNSLLVQRLGVRTLTGLTGNVSIPKAGAGLSSGWVAEGQPLPESQMDFESVTLTPRHVGGITEMSRQLIQQSAPAIEDLVREELSFAVASAIDKSIIAGTGANGQPQGIIGRTGVLTVTELPGSWSAVLDIEQKLAALNITPSGWYTSPGILTTLRKVLKAPSAGSDYVATTARIGELPVASSNAAPTNTAILGDWSQVLLGQWGAVEILVNPYAETPYRRGGVLVRAMATVDVAVRHEAAFVVAKGA